MTYRAYADDIWLCTLDDVKTERYGGGASETFSADDDATIAYYIKQASREIVDQVLHQLPLPYVATYKFDAPHTYEDGRMLGYITRNWYVLHVGDVAPLLAVTTLTNGDSTVTASSEYVLEPANIYPKFKIRIKNDSSETWTYDDEWEQAISVAGTWGYVPQYDNAWLDSGKDVPAGDITAGATSFTFSTASDAGTYSAGDYLRMDSEVMLVTDTNTSTGVVTVTRAVLGTSAASHTAGTDIETFQQQRQIVTETARYVSILYNQDRGVYESTGPRPRQAFDDLRQKLQGHARYNV